MNNKNYTYTYKNKKHIVSKLIEEIIKNGIINNAVIININKEYKKGEKKRT